MKCRITFQGGHGTHEDATEWLEEEEMKALRIDINKYFKAEIDRAFDVLGIDKGEIQNMIDIAAWLKDGYISKKQYEELKAYIKERASLIPTGQPVGVQ